jgi:DNA/RNA endonuclease G (NUC1)
MRRFVLTAVLLGVLLNFLISPADAFIDASLQMQLGNPSGTIVDTNNHDHFLIQRTVEAIDYSDNLGEPNWASWDLTSGDANGAVARQDSFAADTNLPVNFYHVGANEYAHSGYDRGHLCDSADRTDSTNDNNLTFLMSNMMPQAPDNNSGVWGNLESYCRSLVQSTNNYELLIICGPSEFDGTKINTNGYVSIPEFTWKIVVVVPPGSGNALSRITATNRVIAVKIPNTNGVSTVWQNFICSANQIQVDTGFNFFTALPADVATALRNKVDGQTNAPPIIFSFSPTSGATNANVIITGTNFNNASAVAFNGANAIFNIDSATQITAIVPTNAGSGFVSVSTSSGTAISTNSFTVLNNGGTVYSGVLVGWDMSGLTGGANNYGISPLPQTTNAPNLSSGGLIRGSGVKTSGSAGANGWGGTGFTNISKATAIASNQFATFSLTASNGYAMSCTSVSLYNYKRSGTGPASGVLQYQIDAGAFTDITNFSYSSASGGGTNATIDLSTITDLQNVGENTNVTFRIVNYGGTSSSGTWYVYDTAGSTALDLAIQGTVTQIVNPPAIAPSISLLTFVNQQFQFAITGATGSNYIIQATTDLSSPNWIPILTNVAPFTFVDTNTTFSQRFYRVQTAP